jgi:hypothetical protein
MRIDDLKTWLLGTGSLSTFIAAKSTTPIPLTAFASDEIILRDYAEPTTEKMLFLDPQPDEVEAGTNNTFFVTERINAYVIVTRGATEAVLRDQAANYLAALCACLETHADFFDLEDREYFNGVEGKVDAKGAKIVLVFKFEE